MRKGDKGVHTFLKGNHPKRNVIARLEFELAYYDVVVQQVNKYVTGDPFFVSVTPNNKI